jgi:hypothetical protein
VRNETWKVECKLELHDARLGGKVATCWRFDYPDLRICWHARLAREHMPALGNPGQKEFTTKGAAVKQLRAWRDQLLTAVQWKKAGAKARQVRNRP